MILRSIQNRCRSIQTAFSRTQNLQLQRITSSVLGAASARADFSLNLPSGSRSPNLLLRSISEGAWTAVAGRSNRQSTSSLVLSAIPFPSKQRLKPEARSMMSLFVQLSLSIHGKRVVLRRWRASNCRLTMVRMRKHFKIVLSEL